MRIESDSERLGRHFCKTFAGIHKSNDTRRNLHFTTEELQTSAKRCQICWVPYQENYFNSHWPKCWPLNEQGQLTPGTIDVIKLSLEIEDQFSYEILDKAWLAVGLPNGIKTELLNRIESKGFQSGLGTWSIRRII